MTNTKPAISTPSLDAPPRVPAPVQRQSPLAKGGLATFFYVARRAPWLLDALRPVAIRLCVGASPAVRKATAANARRIFDHPLTWWERISFARNVVRNFYDFVTDAAQSASLTREQLASKIERVVGEPAYLTARKQHPNGAVLVTAHMGTFEVGLAALRGVEENVHVVFKRDAYPAFEFVRKHVHETLGVHEAPIDDGFPALIRLRDTLRDNGVVVIQADRAMPGQRSETVPLLGGHIRVPSGPVKLAQLTGSPIVPVFVVRSGTNRKRFEVHLCEPIHIDPHSVDGPAEAQRRITTTIASFIKRYPEQWLVLEPAFVEDETRGGA